MDAYLQCCLNSGNSLCSNVWILLARSRKQQNKQSPPLDVLWLKVPSPALPWHGPWNEAIKQHFKEISTSKNCRSVPPSYLHCCQFESWWWERTMSKLSRWYSDDCHSICISAAQCGTFLDCARRWGEIHLHEMSTAENMLTVTTTTRNIHYHLSHSWKMQRWFSLPVLQTTCLSFRIQEVAGDLSELHMVSRLLESVHLRKKWLLCKVNSMELYFTEVPPFLKPHHPQACPLNLQKFPSPKLATLLSPSNTTRPSRGNMSSDSFVTTLAYS